jgi:uroporphyrinogen decarboxylase
MILFVFYVSRLKKEMNDTSDQTGREIVLKTIKHRKPDRMALAKGRDSDMYYVSCSYPVTVLENGCRLDEWGCVWKSINRNPKDQGQVIINPLSDWDQIEKFTFPNAKADDRFGNIQKELEKIDCSKVFVVGNLGFGPMHLLEHLRGFEAYLTDMMLYPERTELLLNIIFTHISDLVKKYAKYANQIDALVLCDDQAIQTGPLFSMDLWDKYFKPHYKELFDLIHESGFFTYVHACGHISKHLIRFHECGLDMIDNKQPELWMDSEEAQQVKGKITYSTCVDIQTTIHSVSLDEIDAEVSRLIKTLSTEDGGFIGTYCDDEGVLRIPDEKVQRMLQAYRSFKWR